ncbi:hypothetical protein EVAR_82960_1 [Eumeta japonica]|uniref:Uncharacterized protein n=1 Tax=Eumeta variegata TaxID=151549 RepID=A0A4C1VR48_EUMVA|nr:hypothetical protein EVAR_82960_1 [Eumeta japonica]
MQNIFRHFPTDERQTQSRAAGGAVGAGAIITRSDQAAPPRGRAEPWRRVNMKTDFEMRYMKVDYKRRPYATTSLTSVRRSASFGRQIRTFGPQSRRERRRPRRYKLKLAFLRGSLEHIAKPTPSDYAAKALVLEASSENVFREDRDTEMRARGWRHANGAGANRNNDTRGGSWSRCDDTPTAVSKRRQINVQV